MSSDDISNRFKQYADADRKKQADLQAERKQREEDRRALNKNHNSILHEAVLGQFEKVKPSLLEEKVVLVTEYDAHFQGFLPTGVIFHLESSQAHSRKRRTMNYRIKILEDSNVEVVRYEPQNHNIPTYSGARVEDLGNVIGRAVADNITPTYTDKVLDLAFQEWFDQ